MDQAVLVEADLHAGTELLNRLTDATYPVTAAAWVHSADHPTWKLALATPLLNDLGRHEAYRRLHAILATSPTTPVTIDRITLVSDDDPTVKNWLSLDRYRSSEGGVWLGSGTVGGRFVDQGFLYSSAGLGFERSVLAALQRIALPNAVVRRAENAFRSSVEFDFILDNGLRRVAIKAKSSVHPLQWWELQQMAVSAWENNPLVVVSQSGFAPEARDELQQQPRLWPVKWASPEDDPQLRESLMQALAANPT